MASFLSSAAREGSYAGGHVNRTPDYLLINLPDWSKLFLIEAWAWRRGSAGGGYTRVPWRFCGGLKIHETKLPSSFLTWELKNKRLPRQVLIRHKIYFGVCTVSTIVMWYMSCLCRVFQYYLFLSFLNTKCIFTLGHWVHASSKFSCVLSWAYSNFFI